jgi:hypothetical protein
LLGTEWLDCNARAPRCPVKIGDRILFILDSDGNPHKVTGQISLGKQLGWNAGM